MEGGRHILYDVFISKTLSLLETEIEITKDYFRYHARSEERRVGKEC